MWGEGWKTSGVRSKIESAPMPGGKSHVQEEDLTKRPVSMRERKEVQELLLWEGIRLGPGRGWNGWQVHSHDRGSQGGLSATSASMAGSLSQMNCSSRTCLTWSIWRPCWLET